MKKILIILTFLILFCGCERQNKTLEDILNENNYIIVDVRTEEEYNNSHLVSAINIPYDEITEETNLDKNKTILVYCASGRRSKIAYDTLKNLSFDVYDLGPYNSINLEKE